MQGHCGIEQVTADFSGIQPRGAVEALTDRRRSPSASFVGAKAKLRTMVRGYAHLSA
jgi:hypothetical protein